MTICSSLITPFFFYLSFRLPFNKLIRLFHNYIHPVKLIFRLFPEGFSCRCCVLLSLDFCIISFSPLSRGCFWKEFSFTFYSSRSSRPGPPSASGGTTSADMVSMKNHPSPTTQMSHLGQSFG